MFGKPRQYTVVVTYRPEGISTSLHKATSAVRQWGPMGLGAAESLVVELGSREDVVKARIEPVEGV